MVKKRFDLKIKSCYAWLMSSCYPVNNIHCVLSALSGKLIGYPMPIANEIASNLRSNLVYNGLIGSPHNLHTSDYPKTGLQMNCATHRRIPKWIIQKAISTLAIFKPN